VEEVFHDEGTSYGITKFSKLTELMRRNLTMKRRGITVLKKIWEFGEFGNSVILAQAAFFLVL
jgi:hypothetical protein